MGLLKYIANSPLALLVCALAGGVAGWFLPFISGPTMMLGQLYMAFINLAALPLLVVITLFGLKRTLNLPKPLSRFLMIAVYAILIVSLCAAIGVALASLLGIGQNLQQDKLHYLGSVVQDAGGEAIEAKMEFFGKEAPAQNMVPQWSAIVPYNFFKVLIEGKVLGIIICTIVMGIGVALVDKKKSAAFMDILDGIYRALELIISQVNLFIPVLVFAMSAYFTATATRATLHALGDFIVLFAGVSLGISALALVFVWKKSKLAFDVVIKALKTPMLISLTSNNATASIPDTIHAMSSRLGFSRGVVEFVVPAASVFMRSGAALYFAFLAVFVGNLYGHQLDFESFSMICLAATLAAFASAGHSGVAVIGFVGVVLHALKLPVEAALVMFMAIDHLCEGPRSLLSLMLACVLIVLVSEGLPSERIESQEKSDDTQQENVRLTFTRNAVVWGFACFLLAAVMIVLLGIGVGMR